MARLSPGVLAALLATGTIAVGEAVARADGQVEAVSDKARAHFDAGVSLLLDPDGARYEDAYREFQVAYAASKSPRILGNLGFCAMKLERDSEAIDAYTRYLDEAPEIDAVEREQIKRDLVTLRSGVVRVIITVSPANATVLDVRHPVRGTPVTNVYVAEQGRVTIGIRPGRHVIKARDGANESPAWELEATPGSAQTHRLVAAPAPQAVAMRAPQSKIAPWLLTGTGAVVLASGAVTGILALRSKDRMDVACPKGECPSSYDLSGETSKTRALVTATDALLISGGVIAATGITWLVLSSTDKEKKAQSSPPPSTTMTTTSTASSFTFQPDVACSTTGCSATARGVF